jgi:hypothetical protein
MNQEEEEGSFLSLLSKIVGRKSCKWSCDLGVFQYNSQTNCEGLWRKGPKLGGDQCHNEILTHADLLSAFKGIGHYQYVLWQSSIRSAIVLWNVYHCLSRSPHLCILHEDTAPHAPLLAKCFWSRNAKFETVTISLVHLGYMYIKRTNFPWKAVILMHLKNNKKWLSGIFLGAV